jgi:hypothetical protein
VSEGTEQAQDDEAAPPAASVRPKRLSAVAISAIVFAGLFGSCNAVTIGGLVASRAIQPALMKHANVEEMEASSELERAQQKMMKRSQELQDRMFPISLSSSALGLVYALALGVVAIGLYKARPASRRLFVGLCAVGLGIEAARGYLDVTAMLEQNAAMAPLMEEMARASAQQAGSAQSPQQKEAAEMSGKFMSGAFAIGQVVGALMLVGFLLAKGAFLLGCALYARNRGVVAFFEARERAGA